MSPRTEVALRVGLVGSVSRCHRVLYDVSNRGVILAVKEEIKHKRRAWLETTSKKYPKNIFPTIKMLNTMSSNKSSLSCFRAFSQNIYPPPAAPSTYILYAQF